MNMDLESGEIDQYNSSLTRCLSIVTLIQLLYVILELILIYICRQDRRTIIFVTVNKNQQQNRLRIKIDGNCA